MSIMNESYARAPAAANQRLARNSGLSRASSSSSSSSNVSLPPPARSESSSESFEDPVDESPLRPVRPKAMPANSSYSTATLGLGHRSFSGNHSGNISILSPAQRIAKESLPSPPASTQQSQSDRGSLGSANSSRAPGNANAGSARPGLAELRQRDQQGGDQDLSPQRSPVTARPTEFDGADRLLNVYIPSPSPMQASPTTEGRATDYLSSRQAGLTHKRSRSPLAQKTISRAASVSSAGRDGMRNSSSRASLDVLSQEEEHEGPDDSMERHKLKRNDSYQSDLSRTSSLKSKDKSSSKGSVTASKLRRVSEAVKQRMFNDGSPNENTASNASSGSRSRHANDISDMRRQASSTSSTSRLSNGDYQTANSNFESPVSEKARSPLGRKNGHSSPVDAFARNNRNSVISLQSIAPESPQSLSATIKGKGKSTAYDLMDKSMQIDEIWNETPPKSGLSMDERQLRQSTPYETRESQMTSPQHRSSTPQYSDGRENSAFASEALRRSGMLTSPSRDRVAETSRALPTSPSRYQLRQERLQKLTEEQQGERQEQVPPPSTSLRVVDEPRERASSTIRYSRSRGNMSLSGHFAAQSGNTPESSRMSNSSRTENREASILPKRSMTSMSQYRDLPSTPAADTSVSSVRSYRTSDPSRTHDSIHRRTTKLSLSPERRTRPPQSTLAGERSYSRTLSRLGGQDSRAGMLEGRGQEMGEASTPAAMRRLESRSTDTKRERTYEDRRSVDGIGSSTSEILARVRTRTLSNQRDYASPAVARARSEAGANRTDVFSHGDSPSLPDTPEKYRTIASSRPRTSASLRNLQVGSQEWWTTVHEIRSNVSESVSGDTRPSSRMATHKQSLDLREPSAYRQSPSLARIDSDSFAERQQTVRASTPSADSQLRHASPDPQPERARYTPTDQLRRQTPSARAPSRNTPHSGYSIRARSQNTTPTQSVDMPLSQHQTILLNAMHELDQVQNPSVGTLSIIQKASALCQNINVHNSVAKSLLEEVRAAQVNAELDSDSEMNHSLQHHSLFQRVSRASNQLSRSSDEQVRLLTELLVALLHTASSKNASALDQSQRYRHDNHMSGGAGIVRSNTIGARSTRRSVSDFAMTPSRSSHTFDQHSPSPVKPIPERSERSRLAKTHGDDLTENAPSPRSLRKGKTASTSQVSQSNVNGYLATSPSRRAANASFPVDDRRRSIASIESHRSSSPTSYISASAPIADRSVSGSSPQDSNLERSGSSRWRPFRNKPAVYDQALPDTSYQRGSTESTSSQLMATLSRAASNYRNR